MTELVVPDFSSYVSFDIETTGFGAKAQIVEIGAARVVDGKITDTFSQLVNPRIKMGYYASQANGITDSMLVGKPFITSVIKDFMDFIGDDILIGHNIKSFDLRYILPAVADVGLSLQNPYLDTMILAKKMKRDLGWHNTKLEYLMAVLGFNRSDAHRALGDALDVVKLYAFLRNPTASEGVAGIRPASAPQRQSPSNAAPRGASASRSERAPQRQNPYVIAPREAPATRTASVPQRPNPGAVLWRFWDDRIHEQDEQIKRQILAAMSDVMPLLVDGVTMTASFGGTNDAIYSTSLKECSCADYSRRSMPCKHIYRLASELGVHRLSTQLSIAEIDNDILKNLHKLKDDLSANPNIARMTDDPDETIELLEQHLIQCVEMTNEAVGATTFMSRINEALSQQCRLKLHVRTLTDRLLCDGYLELDENNQRVASKKGNRFGIVSAERKKDTGEAFMQNLYDAQGQTLLLKYVLLALRGK